MSVLEQRVKQRLQALQALQAGQDAAAEGPQPVSQVPAAALPSENDARERAAELEANGGPHEESHPEAEAYMFDEQELNAHEHVEHYGHMERQRSRPDVVSRLYQKANEYEQRRERMVERRFAPKKPAINPRSEAIASRTGVSVQERLLSGVKSFNAKSWGANKAVSPDKFTRGVQDANLTFQPKIDANSAQMASASRPPVATHERLYHHVNEDVQRRRAELKAQKDEAEVKECTFAPRTLKNVPGMEHPPGGLGDHFERHMRWKAKLDERLDRQRREMEQREIAACTFRPSLEKSPSDAVVSAYEIGALALSPRSPKGGAGSPTGGGGKGVQEFLERCEVARRMREERKNVPHATGEKWRPQGTRPQPFQLTTELRMSAHKARTARRKPMWGPEEAAAPASAASAPSWARGELRGSSSSLRASASFAAAMPRTPIEELMAVRAAAGEPEEAPRERRRLDFERRTPGGPGAAEAAARRRAEELLEGDSAGESEGYGYGHPDANGAGYGYGDEDDGGYGEEEEEGDEGEGAGPGARGINPLAGPASVDERVRKGLEDYYERVRQRKEILAAKRAEASALALERRAKADAALPSWK
eukprot:tig00021238_g19550.t1